MSNEIRPFQFNVPAEDLIDLKSRLAQTRWPEQETVEDWSQGVPLSFLQDFVGYWQHDYDWSARQARLNQFDQFTTTIDGLDIHFLHVRSQHEDALPLVITHGWPGSIVEFYKVIEPLTNPTAFGGSADDAFHIVCPTLPGFGYSGKPEMPGWNVEKTADAWAELMQRLGYERYVAQGGDWGSIVTCQIGIQDEAHCAGIHINMVVCAPDQDTMSDLSDIEKSALKGLKYYQDWDSGYSKLQSTRPQTIGYSLADSPVGQAAWILEKFWSWTDCDDNPLNVLTHDELLDNIMLYWMPNCGASSARLYWESFRAKHLDEVRVPTGCSLFPKEIMRASKRWAEKRFSNIVHFNVLDKGGHFAAFEQPELFIAEVRESFRHLR